jgi:hypothetical protein
MGNTGSTDQPLTRDEIKNLRAPQAIDYEEMASSVADKIWSNFAKMQRADTETGVIQSHWTVVYDLEKRVSHKDIKENLPSFGQMIAQIQVNLDEHIGEDYPYSVDSISLSTDESGRYNIFAKLSLVPDAAAPISQVTHEISAQVGAGVGIPPLEFESQPDEDEDESDESSTST